MSPWILIVTLITFNNGDKPTPRITTEQKGAYVTAEACQNVGLGHLNSVRRLMVDNSLGNNSQMDVACVNTNTGQSIVLK